MKKSNLFDFLVILSFVALAVLILVLASQRQRDLGRPTLVTIKARVSDEVRTEAKKGETVFLNAQKAESRVVAVQEEGNNTLITIEGLGEKNGEIYLFNGQRVLIGKKAELHGGFWAQGTVIRFEIK